MIYSKFQQTIVVFLFCIYIVVSNSLVAQSTPFPNAHSHNDYERPAPLKDALKHNFTSVEADVLYIYGKLYVGHNMPDSRWHKLKKIKKQYLKPLYRRFRKNKKEIYPGYKGDFYLWVDIKFEPAKAYRSLRKLLEPYKEMLNYYDHGKFHKGKVTVILSGARPFELLLKDSLQLMTLDGRPSDLDENYPTELMPFISEDIGKVAGIEEVSQFNEEALLLIQGFANKAKAQNKKTRLWATPEKEDLWEILLNVGIDLINTDDLGKLTGFLLKRK